MMVALGVSVKHCGFASAEAKKIQQFLGKAYAWPQFELEKDAFFKLVSGDKKNRGSSINMVLLKNVGEAFYNCEIEFESIWESYQNLVNGAD